MTSPPHGVLLDLDDAYVTLKNDYIETVWWILKAVLATAT